VKIDVVSIDKAKDPDELIKKDPKLWQKAVEDAKYAPDYIINLGKKNYDLSSAPGKKQFFEFILPMLRNLNDDIELQHYTKKIAQLLDVMEESIQKALHKKTPVITPVKAASPESLGQSQNSNTKKRQLSHLEKLEQELLELTLAFSQTRVALRDLELEQTSDLHRSIFRILINTGNAQLSSIVKGLPKEGNYVKILALRGEQKFADLSAHDKRLEAFTQVARIHEINRQLNKRNLARQIAEAESAGDTKKAKQLLRQYQELVNEE
jgi:DNA primase